MYWRVIIQEEQPRTVIDRLLYLLEVHVFYHSSDHSIFSLFLSGNQSLQGVCDYREISNNSSIITHPLQRLSTPYKKSEKIEWSEEW
jgi:hypothetical protein